MTRLFAVSARGLKWLAMLLTACAIALVLQFAMTEKAWAADHPVASQSDLVAAIGAATSGDTIVLTADITLTSGITIPAGLDVTITSDSSGRYSLLRNWAFPNYLVSVSGSLTITDVTFDGNGGGTRALVLVSSAASSGGSSGGMLTINGGAVLTNNHGADGGAIDNRGTVVMNDGLIANNAASVGAGIYNYFGSFTMNGGIIQGNVATHHAGGIDNNSGGVTVVHGGSILGNWAGGIGSAVYYHNTGTATVGPGAVVEHSIDGTVFDAVDNSITLPATVQLMNGTTPVGSPVTAATDGTFQILFMPDVPDYSAYSLLVTYVGYDDKTVAFAVDAWDDARKLMIPLGDKFYPVIEHYGEYGGSGDSAAVVDAVYGTAPFNSLVLYLQDGSYATVDTAMYTVSADANGKLVITLSEQYLQTFVAGEYYFVAIFDDGISDYIVLTLPNSALPATGDSLLPLSALVLSFMAAALLIVVGLRRMRAGRIQ